MIITYLHTREGGCAIVIVVVITEWLYWTLISYNIRSLVSYLNPGLLNAEKAFRHPLFLLLGFFHFSKQGGWFKISKPTLCRDPNSALLFFFFQRFEHSQHLHRRVEFFNFLEKFWRGYIDPPARPRVVFSRFPSFFKLTVSLVHWGFLGPDSP